MSYHSRALARSPGSSCSWDTRRRSRTTRPDPVRTTFCPLPISLTIRVDSTRGLSESRVAAARVGARPARWSAGADASRPPRVGSPSNRRPVSRRRRARRTPRRAERRRSRRRRREPASSPDAPRLPASCPSSLIVSIRRRQRQLEPRAPVAERLPSGHDSAPRRCAVSMPKNLRSSSTPVLHAIGDPRAPTATPPIHSSIGASSTLVGTPDPTSSAHAVRVIAEVQAAGAPRASTSTFVHDATARFADQPEAGRADARRCGSRSATRWSASSPCVQRRALRRADRDPRARADPTPTPAEVSHP